MPCVNDEVFKQRLLNGIVHYQMEKQHTGKTIHRQRQQDIMNLSRMICTSQDGTLLERNVMLYLDQMPVRRTWSQFFFMQSQVSELRDVLMSIVQDENRKYYLGVALLMGSKASSNIESNDTLVTYHSPDSPSFS